MDDLYAEEIIAHYEHPRNKGKMEKPSAMIHEYNPICGDDITVYLKIDGEKVSDIKFDGTGCAISIASASMMTEFVKGMTVQDAEKIRLDKLIEIIGIDPGPARLKCATLSLRAIKEALFLYQHKEVDKETRSL
jgi:nitrogen fixation protein NifU and related proteins